MKPIVFVLAMSMAFGSACAQEDSSGIRKMQFKISLNYNTGLNYYGRADSIRSTGFFPLAELWFTKELYVNAAPVFVNNSLQSFNYAGTITTLGYLRVTKKWIYNFYLLKPFYKQSSRLVQSALKAQSGAGISFLNSIVNISAGADVKLSDKVDAGAMVGVDHIFRRELKNSSVFVIDPSIYVYAGTQNFSSAYYKNKTGFLFLPGTPETVTSNIKKFNVLAYEFSVPLIYAKGKWMASIIPAYVMPQNLISISGRPDLSEKGGNMFYATASLKRSF